jgi:superfamily II DNA or RNA helicase
MKLLPYQISSYEDLVAAVPAHGAALDASDTGVGKTHVACAVCKELGLRLAIVCPKNLIPVWRKACSDWGLPRAQSAGKRQKERRNLTSV